MGYNARYHSRVVELTLFLQTLSRLEIDTLLSECLLLQETNVIRRIVCSGSSFFLLSFDDNERSDLVILHLKDVLPNKIITQTMALMPVDHKSVLLFYLLYVFLHKKFNDKFFIIER